jgi:hypothetical protein
MQQHHLCKKKLTPYHPQENGQDEVILGDKFCSWANFPWFFPKKDSLF